MERMGWPGRLVGRTEGVSEEIFGVREEEGG